MSHLDQYLTSEEQLVTPEAQVKSLDTIVEEVSLEAFLVGDITGYVSKKAGEVTNSIKEGFRKLFVTDYKKPESLDVAGVSKKLADLKFLDICETDVHTPIGYNKEDLSKYARFLEDNYLPALETLISKVIAPSQKRFAYYIDNLDDTNQRTTLVGGSERSEADLKKLVDGQAKFFIKGNRGASRPIEDVFANKDAINATFKTLEAINTKYPASASADKVNKEVEKLSDLSQTLFKLLQEGNGRASPEFLKAIAQELLLVGQWVEWYASAITTLTDFTTAMKHNEQVIKGL